MSVLAVQRENLSRPDQLNKLCEGQGSVDLANFFYFVHAACPHRDTID
jgi:hypothetical protein